MDAKLLDTYNFPACHYTRAELCQWAIVMFDQLGILEYLGVSDEKMMAFLEAVAKRYQPNPYHHFTHAFTLT